MKRKGEGGLGGRGRKGKKGELGELVDRANGEGGKRINGKILGKGVGKMKK